MEQSQALKDLVLNEGDACTVKYFKETLVIKAVC